MLESMTTPRRGLPALRRAGEDGQLDALAHRAGLELVVVFGSVTDPSVGEPADLDVAVRFSDCAPPDHVDVTNELIQCQLLDTTAAEHC